MLKSRGSHAVMSMKLLKKLFIVVGLLATTVISANQNNCREPCSLPPCDECLPCCEIPGGPTKSAYNHPANIKVCGCWDVFAAATFLWILPGMEQLEFAQTTYSAGTINVGRVYEYNYEWKPAFKFGLGYNFKHDNWDAYLQYLRINTSMSDKQHVGNHTGEHLNGSLEQLVNANGDAQTCSEVKGKWHLDFNIFDLEFGRPYYNGKFLQFRGHCGLKGGWINHTFNQFNTVSLLVYEGFLSSKSWLIGPRAGFQTKWTFDDGLRLFGNAAASVFCQRFHKIRIREPYINNQNQWFVASNYSLKHLTSCLESIIGIGWGSYFDRNNWHYDLEIGYEGQLFFNQNQMARMKNYVNLKDNVNPVSKAGNFFFHGLNVTMQFDF